MNEHVPTTATGRWMRRPSPGHAPPLSGEAVGFTPAASNRGRECHGRAHERGQGEVFQVIEGRPEEEAGSFF